jgi:uncharacterized membrane protein YcaP (DUF421 family)
MDAVLRGIVIYIFLSIIFRLAGKRALTEITTFDMVLIVIIAESTQQGLLGEDFSVTTACLLILTLIGLNVGLQLLKQRFPRFERLTDGLPVIILENGQPLRDRMKGARVLDGEIISAARQQEGVERLDQLKYAVLERNGSISVIPKDETQELLQRIEERLERIEARIGSAEEQPDGLSDRVLRAMRQE